jgi:hypothetical protein
MSSVLSSVGKAVKSAVGGVADFVSDNASKILPAAAAYATGGTSALLKNVAGQAIGSLASSSLGSALGAGQTVQTPVGQSSTQVVPGSNFQPFTYTTGLGGAAGRQIGQYGFETTTGLDPRLMALQEESLNLIPSFSGLLASQYLRSPAQFDFTFDPSAAGMQYYKQGMEMLRPEIAAASEQLKENLYGKGTRGLSIAGTGLGAGGAVNPDVYATNLAANRAMADLYTTSMDKGLEAEKARLEASRGILGTQEGLQADYLSRLGKGMTDIFGLGLQVQDIESSIMKDAIAAEVQRANALKTGTSSTQWSQPREAWYSGAAAETGNIFGDFVGGLFSSPSSSNRNIVPAGSAGGSMMSGINPLMFMP